jgi:transcriptional regulator with XRE-family HTH domain
MDMDEPQQPSDAQIRLNPNRLVSYNLRRARMFHGWTQPQAAERLEPYLGVRWAKQTFSQAEAGAISKGRRPRQFDAAEVAAFALAFGFPIGWFYMPPLAVQVDGELGLDGVLFNMPGEPGVPLADLLASVIHGQASIDARLEDALPMGNTGYRGLEEALREKRDRVRAIREQEQQS